MRKSWQQKQKDRIAYLEQCLEDVVINPDSEQSKAIINQVKLKYTTKQIMGKFPSQFNILSFISNNMRHCEDGIFVWNESGWPNSSAD